MNKTLYKNNIHKTTFNVSKYKKNIRELIMKMYHVDNKTATVAINYSGLDESLRISPELTSHIADEEWAAKIWSGYLKKGL